MHRIRPYNIIMNLDNLQPNIKAISEERKLWLQLYHAKHVRQKFAHDKQIVATMDALIELLVDKRDN